MGGLGTAFSADVQSVTKSSLVTPPLSVMPPRPGGFEAVWGVSRLSRGWLEWELEGGSKGKAKADAFGFTPQGDDVLRVRLDGFNPHTRGRMRSRTIA